MAMAMEKKGFPTLAQVAKIAWIVLLFLLLPLVPSSLRPPYVYLLFNALVVALGVEAGFLASISGAPRDDRRHVTRSLSLATLGAAPRLSGGGGSAGKPAKKTTTPKKKAAASKKMRRCPSRASIFFIGGGDDEDAVVHAEEEEEATVTGAGAGEHMMSKQELFTKAEAFIGNFYKQLKMQREESWKKLQDLYHHHHYKTKAL
uniref:DUF4408 domain-containing protein n=1 Tax=Oryza brachyantha TaxID=4533 RepID=J3L0R3_ORYBR